LRSSPTLSGRCCDGLVDVAEPGDLVAILHRSSRVGAPVDGLAQPPASPMLRSSPSLSGRCCTSSPKTTCALGTRLRCSPTPKGRCCSRVLRP